VARTNHLDIELNKENIKGLDKQTNKNNLDKPDSPLQVQSNH